MHKSNKISLKPFNSFGVDVIATDFNIAKSKKEVISFLKKKENPLILGGGTNILFKKNIKRSIIKIDIKGIKVTDLNKNQVKVNVGAGENWNDFVLWSLDHGYGGLENLSLIPGNVGSAPIQNIGAYGVELKDVFISCETVSIKNGLSRNFSNLQCRFSYRSSIFKEQLKNKYIICNVNFILTKKNHNVNFSYSSLKKILKENNITSPTIKDISKFVSKIRLEKLPDPKLIGNCGSFFKNPIVNRQKFIKLESSFKEIPFYKISNNELKIPAAWLIEKSGFKGKRFGSTGTYKSHALVIINYGNATGKEIYKFSQKIKQAVLRNFNILLEEEVNIIE
ncbi:MAG: UDP-N-acetylmuramate dehydrogenase [Flavobacteriaceae bacterium]